MVQSIRSRAALAAHSGGRTMPPSAAQTVAGEETVRSVRRMLARLPYYGVFEVENELVVTQD
jgi:hypothetical protein